MPITPLGKIYRSSESLTSYSRAGKLPHGLYFGDMGGSVMSRALFVFLWCFALNANAIVMTPEQAAQPENKSTASAPSNSKVPAKPIEKRARSANSPRTRAAASAPLKALEAPSKASLGFFQAALYGNYDMMELYLQQGADINCLNCDSNYQWTALYRALAANGSWNLQLGDWLVQRGADINIPAVNGGATGSTLVMASASAYTPNLQALEWLVQRGANVKVVDSLGRTPLHHVSQWGHMDSPYGDTGRKLAAFVDLLVDNGIDINGPDKGGVTALMNAANACSPNAVRLLISHGANTTVKDKLGKTAMDMTMERATHSGQNSPCNEVIKILSNAPQASVSTPSQTSGNPVQRNAVNYAGTYSGTYGGSDSGTFQVSIAQDGTAKLSGRSSRMGTSFTGEGKVSSDGSVAVGSANTGSTFIGSVSPSGTLSGTWKNTAYNQAGTFQGNKGATDTAANPLEVINGGLQLLNAILKPR
jgi:hypothetical protein